MDLFSLLAGVVKMCSSTFRLLSGPDCVHSTRDKLSSTRLRIIEAKSPRSILGSSSGISYYRSRALPVAQLATPSARQPLSYVASPLQQRQFADISELSNRCPPSRWKPPSQPRPSAGQHPDLSKTLNLLTYFFIEQRFGAGFKDTGG